MLGRKARREAARVLWSLLLGASVWWGASAAAMAEDPAHAAGDAPALVESPALQDGDAMARIRNLSGFEVAASGALVPGWEGATVLVFPVPQPSVRIPLPGLGSDALQIGYLAGEGYAGFRVLLDRVEIGHAPAQDGEARRMVVTVPLAHSGTLDLIPDRTQPVALYCLNPLIPKLQPQRPEVWQALGGGRYEAWLYHPVPYSYLFFRLQSPVACTLSAAGQTLVVCGGGRSASGGAIVRALTKMELVVSDPAVTPDRLEVGCSSLRGGALYRQLPTDLAGGVDDGRWPRVEIQNGLVQATLSLPDAERGFYRGQRFEAAGLVTSLRFAGHELVSCNQAEQRNPMAVDHVAGPAEEFFEAVGYGDPEGVFLKIGSGIYGPATGREYFFGWTYRPVQRLPWQTVVRDDAVEFRQSVKTDNGWGYTYVKRLTLPPGRAELRVEHELQNTGRRRILSSHYSHNFWLVDRIAPGPDYTLHYGFFPQFLNPESPKHLTTEEGDVAVWEAGVFYTPVAGCRRASENTVTLQHRPSGISIELVEDQAPYRMALFLNRYGICPESYVRIDLAPGRSMRWTRTYRFHQGPTGGL